VHCIVYCPPQRAWIAVWYWTCQVAISAGVHADVPSFSAVNFSLMLAVV